MIMSIDDYSGWFGEAVNDPHADFRPVLHTCRPDADNTATLAELNATWAEDDDLNPLLGLDAADGRHFIVFAARKVPRSAGGHASAYAGQSVAQFGDVGAGVTGLRFVSVGNDAFSRLSTAANPLSSPFSFPPTLSSFGDNSGLFLHRIVQVWGRWGLVKAQAPLSSIEFVFRELHNDTRRYRVVTGTEHS